MEYLILGNGVPASLIVHRYVWHITIARGMAARICVTQIVQPIQ